VAADRRPPRWAAPVTLALSLAGVAVAGYLTYEHYTTASTLACPNKGVLNCLKVTTSAESRLVGVPVALLGLLFFLGMVAICLPAAWRSPSPTLHWARLAASASGVAMVVYLIYVELFVLDAICIWCTAAHGIALALFTAVALAMAAAGVREDAAVG
jgi:uncharacterized membrane protein